MTAESHFVRATLAKQFAIALCAASTLQSPVILFDHNFVEKSTVMAGNIRVSVDSNGRYGILSAGAQQYFSCAKYLNYMRDHRIVVEKKVVTLPFPYDPNDRDIGFQTKVIGLEYTQDLNVVPLSSESQRPGACVGTEGCTSEKCASGCTTPMFPPDHPWFEPGGCPVITHFARDLYYISTETDEVCEM